MEQSNDTLMLDKFYPTDCLKIIEVKPETENILIRMRSVSRECCCPKCGKITNQYHGTYTRRVQDIPIPGKNVRLEIKVHEYNCTNEGCDISTIAESFDGFLNTYSRLTERCADFICTLALETSCEGCSRIKNEILMERLLLMKKAIIQSRC